MRLLLLSISFLAVLAHGRPSIAQPVDERFSDEIDVRVLNLEVVVHDDDRNPVAGLTVDDFRVKVGGEVLPIEFFSEVHERPNTEEASGLQPAGSAGPIDPPVNYLVFFDDLMTLKRNRDVVVEGLLREIEMLRPHDRVAVVRYGGRRAGGQLEVLTEWTSDRVAIRDALQRAATTEAYGIKYIALRRMDGYVANWEGNDTRRSILAASGALRALTVPEGRKALLLVAGSWDPAEAARSDRFSPWCVSGPCHGWRIYNVLVDTANQLGYSVYAIDVEGRDPDINWSREKRLQSVLGQIADATGGRALLNGQRTRVLSTATSDKRVHYSLGVRVDTFDDQRLGIEVNVRRPGLRVRTQQTAVRVSQQRQRELDVFNALWLPHENDDSGFAVRLGDATFQRARTLQLPLSVVVPTAALEWPDGHEASFDVRAAFVDPKGRSSEVSGHAVRLVGSGGVPEVFLHFPLELEMQRRRHRIAVSVHDLNGDRTFTRVVEFDPRDHRPSRRTIASNDS